MQFHENDQSPYNHDFDFRQMHWVDPGKWVYVIFGQSTETQNLKKSSLNCDEENKIKIPDCVDKYYSKKLGCLLPWTTNTNEGVCDGETKFEEFRNLSKSILLPQIKRELKEAGCFVPNCHKTKWDIKATSVYDDQGTTGMEFSIFHNSKLTVRKEVELYTFTNFYAEIGGYLGLFLGESIASFISMSIDGIKIITEKLKKK